MAERTHRIDAEALIAQTGRLRALARSLVHGTAAADDLVQDAFVLSLERGGPRAGDASGERVAGEHMGWWAGVMRNLARRTHRGEGRRTRREQAVARAESEASDTDTREALARADLLRRLLARVLELDEPYKTTVVLRFFEERSAEQIARETGVPASTVRTRLARALERLRVGLDDEHDGDRAAWSALLLPASAAATTHAAPTTAGLGMGGVVMGMKVRLGITAVVVAVSALAWRAAVDVRGEEPGASTPIGEESARAGIGEALGASARAALESGAGEGARLAARAPGSGSNDLGTMVFGSVLGTDGALVADASIAFVDESAGVLRAQVGAPGSYALLGVAAGAYRVAVEASGYVARSSDLMVPRDAPRVRHDLVLDPAPEIAVRFVDERGDRRTGDLPLAAVATIAPPPRLLPGVSGRDASSCGVGRYLGRSRYRDPIEGLGPEHNGILRLSAAPPLYVSAVLSDVVVDTRRIDGTEEELELLVPSDAIASAHGELRLRVVDGASGAPLSGATVVARDSDLPVHAGPTRADGLVELESLLSGLVELDVQAEDYVAVRTRARISPGETTDRGDVRLFRAARITGRIVDEHGDGVAASLTCHLPDTVASVRDVDTYWSFRSAADGSFAIHGVRARMALVANDGEWASDPLLVDASSGNLEGVELVLLRGTAVRFRTAGDLDGARCTFATAGGKPFASTALRGALPFERRLAPGPHQAWLGWDEDVAVRVSFDVPSGGGEPFVVELPTLEPRR